MPVGYNKVPFSLQEKIDKAIQVTYTIRDHHDADFMRAFLVELIEKAFKKIVQERLGDRGDDIRKYPLGESEATVLKQIDDLKRETE